MSFSKKLTHIKLCECVCLFVCVCRSRGAFFVLSTSSLWPLPLMLLAWNGYNTTLEQRLLKRKKLKKKLYTHSLKHTHTHANKNIQCQKDKDQMRNIPKINKAVGFSYSRIYIFFSLSELLKFLYERVFGCRYNAIYVCLCV